MVSLFQSWFFFFFFCLFGYRENWRKLRKFSFVCVHCNFNVRLLFFFGLCFFFFWVFLSCYLFLLDILKFHFSPFILLLSCKPLTVESFRSVEAEMSLTILHIYKLYLYSRSRSLNCNFMVNLLSVLLAKQYLGLLLNLLKPYDFRWPFFVCVLFLVDFGPCK